MTTGKSVQHFNQASVIIKFKRLGEHKNASSSIGKHFHVKHSYVPKDVTKNFTTLKKFDCLIYKMVFILLPFKLKLRGLPLISKIIWL